jgi:energy-coupling factor transporter ATP-binding protein EcfA2
MSDGSAGLLRRIDAFVEAARARDLLPPDLLRPLAEQAQAARATGLDRPIDPLLVVMLCGPTAVGKSSLLNALAGKEIAPVGVGATTDAPLVYVHEDDDPARLFGYGQTLGVMAEGGPGLIRHARAGLRHKVIVDTPDIDSAVRAHRAVTEAAVTNADIVLYVTSPEKYKVEEPLRWLAAHRRRHGLAFVLNKWDAEGMGIQFARRQGVAEDFAALLGDFGFAAPVLFTVSVRDRPDSDGGRGLAALQTWLSARLDRSTAASIAALRRRAGWGELAAALSAAIGGLAGTREDMAPFAGAWTEAGAAAAGIVEAEAGRLTMASLPSVRPRSPGVFGLMLPLLHRPRWLSSAAGTEPAKGGIAFGAAALPALRRAADELELLARARRLPLGGVPAGWAETLDALARDLTQIPARAEAEVVAASLRAKLRRAVASLWLGAIEIIIAGVMALTLWRLAVDFLAGRYAPFSLLGSAVAIIVLVALFGEAGMRLLFPDLSARLAAAARRGAKRRVDAAVAALIETIAAQIEAAYRLRDEGAALLTEIDRETRALAAQAAEDGDAARLFGGSPAGAAARVGARFD